jgi:ribosomal protein L10
MLPRLAGATSGIPFQVRTYAVSVSPPRVYTGKKVPREYSSRKTFLYNEYTQLLSKNSPLLFLTHNNFSAQQLIKLRREIAVLKPSAPPSLALSTAPVSAKQPKPPKFMVIRTGLLGVALRDRPGMMIHQKRDLAKLVTPGALGVLTLPDLHPPQLSALLRILERAVPPPKPPLTPEEEEAQRVAVRLAMIENPTPGRRAKRFRPDLTPELELRGALIEGRLFVKDALKDVGKLPTLDTLRAQLLGLISTPAAQLAGVIGAASGGQLARTLEGFRKGLEMDMARDTAEGNL